MMKMMISTVICLAFPHLFSTGAERHCAGGDAQPHRGAYSGTFHPSMEFEGPWK